MADVTHNKNRRESVQIERSARNVLSLSGETDETLSEREKLRTERIQGDEKAE